MFFSSVTLSLNRASVLKSIVCFS
uniref:Uncharacterized protein n=1 Tax=Anguilla anguilla TaxID=7936 RepID=A0A0E9VVY6_ANGAN